MGGAHLDQRGEDADRLVAFWDMELVGREVFEVELDRVFAWRSEISNRRYEDDLGARASASSTRSGVNG